MRGGPPLPGPPMPGPPRPGPPLPGPPSFGPSFGPSYGPSFAPPPPPLPPRRKRGLPIVLVVLAVAIAVVLGTGLGWPGWWRGGTVDRSTPEATARATVDALNRRDVTQFVDELVCADGRRPGDDGSTSLAQETLYRDIAPFRPGSDPAVKGAAPTFTVEEVRPIRPDDIGYTEQMVDAHIAVVAVAYPAAAGAPRPELRPQKGVLALVEEEGAWLVCEMGFVAVDGPVPPDPDPTSPTGRAQAFVAAVNAGDIATARIYICARGTLANRAAERAIREGGQLRLNRRVEPPGGKSAQLQLWYTAGGQERRLGGIMQQESDGWCVLSL